MAHVKTTLCSKICVLYFTVTHRIQGAFDN